MDKKTEDVLKKIKFHLRIRKLAISCSYFVIICGIFIYILSALNKKENIKLVNDIKENKEKYQTEKIMKNPSIKLQYNENQIYNIKAKEAFHKDESEIILYEVFAEGEIGNISSGQLQISESGDHLVFTKNPVLILKEIKKK